jgi:hypothetical protein
VSAATEAHKQDGSGGSQALHCALRNNHVAVAEALLDKGADPNAIGRYGRTPLTCAVSEMSLDGVWLMLRRGADVNLKTKRKDVAPPLYVAVSAITATTSMKMVAGKMVMEVEAVWARRPDIMEIFRLLIEAGADPNAPGPRNYTPLHDLAFCRKMPDDLRFPLVEMLMNAGARPDVPTKDGGTALTAAKLFKHDALFDLLSRPVPERKPPPDAAPAPGATETVARGKSPKAKPKPAKADTELGAAHFHRFISDGEAEWAVLAVRAPIDLVTDAFARFVKAGNVSRDVPVKPAAKGTDEVARAIVVVEVRDNRWAIVLLSLFYLDGRTLGEANEAARTLSAELKTRAIVYLNHDKADEAGYSTFENGSICGPEMQEIDEDDADQSFREQEIYLPACYPKSNANGTWLAAEKHSAKRIARADVISRPDQQMGRH